jgi:hypothetical protein
VQVRVSRWSPSGWLQRLDICLVFILDHVTTSHTQHRAVSLVDKEHARRWCCRWSRSSRIDEHKSSNQRTRVVADSDNAIEKGAYECKPLRLRRLWSTPVASCYRSVSALLGAQIVFYQWFSRHRVISSGPSFRTNVMIAEVSVRGL